MIRVLDKIVADKIAAGEVVERPLSVVKELVENAVDAGATTITVEIRNGGKSYLRVTDNGCGIPSDEVLLAFTRHATSKIVTDKDLESIQTLGFRGEALASIAAVSRTELVTKEPEAHLGKRVMIAGGTVLEHTEAGCPDGTTVIVRDLFFNTPARLKFLKSDSAESSLIIDFVSRMALAYPEIRIRLVNNGNILFSTNGKGDIRMNILTVYSREIADNLVPVHFEQEPIRITGFVSQPGYSASTRRNQIFFVNGRSVNSKVIEKGIGDAYRDRLFEGRHPAAFLFLRIAPEKLDVNIHPNKKEVQFDDAARVTKCVEEAVKEALSVQDAIPQFKEKNIFRFREPENPYQNRENNHEKEEVLQRIDSSETLREIHSNHESERQVNINSLLSNIRFKEQMEQAEKERGEFEKPDCAEEEPNPGSAAKKLCFEDLRVVGSIFSTYIALVDEDSFYLVDQHAAHERVFFEKLLREHEESENLTQPLLTPLLVSLPHSTFESAGESMKALRKFGFEIEPFGSKTFAVRSIPMFMALSEAENFLQYFAENVSDGSLAEDPKKLEAIASRACKAAVKGGDLLKEEEIRELLHQLSRCKNPFSCPHGRPTFIRMRRHEIEKMFKRV